MSITKPVPKPAPRRGRSLTARRKLQHLRSPYSPGPVLSKPAELSVERVEAALHENGDDLRSAAMYLGIARGHLVRFMAHHEAEFADFRADLRATMLLLVEDNIRQALEHGEPWATRFVLSRLGSDHGWSRKRHKPSCRG